MTIEVPVQLAVIIAAVCLWAFWQLFARLVQVQKDLFLTWRFLQKYRFRDSQCTLDRAEFVLFAVHAETASCLFATPADVISFVNSPDFANWISRVELAPKKARLAHEHRNNE